jgi:hypothetical protein
MLLEETQGGGEGSVRDEAEEIEQIVVHVKEGRDLLGGGRDVGEGGGGDPTSTSLTHTRSPSPLDVFHRATGLELPTDFGPTVLSMGRSSKMGEGGEGGVGGDVVDGSGDLREQLARFQDIIHGKGLHSGTVYVSPGV